MLDYAIRLSRLSEEADRAVAATRGTFSGELIIGASTTIAQNVLPQQPAAFARQFPAVKLQMFSQNTDHICEGVASGDYMLGFIEGPSRRQD